MRATLIYNASAGSAATHTPEDLQAALLDAGWTPSYRPTTSEEDLDRVLEDPGDLVVVAGGDGSFRAVATRLIGTDVPIAILPMGTANNTALTLGLPSDPLEIIAGLRQPLARRFDVGTIEAPWGQDFFVEAAGFGIFATLLKAYDPDAGKSVLRAATSILGTLPSFAAIPTRLELDGEVIESPLLLLEVMNTRLLGPKVTLTPDADPSDGLLDVIFAREDARVGFTRYLTSLAANRLEDLPNVEVRRVSSFRCSWDGSPFHVDGELRPCPTPASQAEPDSETEAAPLSGETPEQREPTEPRTLEGGTVDFGLRAGAVTLLLPQPVAETVPAGLNF
ncbi:MAG TPA: diacylglycerol kinase family protein, partial [Deinococcales bacterium]|nr:diacylglycerol kinase family protein [Deinococcales bacterium]